MVGTSDENDLMMLKIIDNSSMIHVQESEKLMVAEKKRSSQMCLEFNDLCYSVCTRSGKGIQKAILHNVTGHFEPGKITVIIGPSGAGKTTMLKIVSGERSLNVKGTIAINGIVRGKGTAFRKQVCYVPQQFSLLPFLTTKETLYIAAQLKFDAKQSKRAMHLIINEIVNNFGLSNCLDTLAYKLSGGERKRLSIGVEIITNPSILLLDEPTSGLDSAASSQLINVLHTMARNNCTVVCAIHQPSSQMISQFDNIIVLDRGRSMYCGPKSEILSTFKKAGFTCPSYYNIAEFVLNVITEQKDEDLETLYTISRNEYESFRSRRKCLKNEINLSTTPDDKAPITFTNDAQPRLSIWRQQKILFYRALLCMKRDIFMTILRCLAHVLVALLLGAVFYNFGDDAEKVNSNIACLFFFLLFLFFANALPAVQMFPTEAAVFLQEHLNNWYSLKSYYSVKIITDLLTQIFCASSFLLITYYMTGQPIEFNRVLQAWSVCVLITILGQTVGILTGTAFNTEMGTFLIPASSIPLLLFSGFFVKINEISKYLQPLGFVSFFRYAFEGLVQAVYVDRSKLSCHGIYCYLRSPDTILSMMDLPTVPFYAILLILGSWIFCLHAVTYSILCWKIYYARK